MELNKALYNASREALTELGLSEHLVDSASRIVATDDASKPDLGRTEVDTEICREAMIQINININSQQD